MQRISAKEGERLRNEMCNILDGYLVTQTGENAASNLLQFGFPSKVNA
jgi:hypothetical protein